MLLNLLMIFIGLSILIYSLFEIRVWGCLFFERDFYCIEKFRKSTKTTDLISCFHNFTKGIFGFTMLLIGIRKRSDGDGAGIINKALIISFVLLILDVMIMEGVTRFYGLKEKRISIEEQWRAEKRITIEHDHEVNLYRGLNRITKQYPRHIIAMGGGTIMLLLFLL